MLGARAVERRDGGRLCGRWEMAHRAWFSPAALLSSQKPQTWDPGMGPPAPSLAGPGSPWDLGRQEVKAIPSLRTAARIWWTCLWAIWVKVS